MLISRLETWLCSQNHAPCRFQARSPHPFAITRTSKHAYSQALQGPATPLAQALRVCALIHVQHPKPPIFHLPMFHRSTTPTRPILPHIPMPQHAFWLWVTLTYPFQLPFCDTTHQAPLHHPLTLQTASARPSPAIYPNATPNYAPQSNFQHHRPRTHRARLVRVPFPRHVLANTHPEAQTRAQTRNSLTHTIPFNDPHRCFAYRPRLGVHFPCLGGFHAKHPRSPKIHPIPPNSSTSTTPHPSTARGKNSPTPCRLRSRQNTFHTPSTPIAFFLQSVHTPQNDKKCLAHFAFFVSAHRTFTSIYVEE